MPLALALSFTEPSTGILAPLAVRRMVESPRLYGMFHLLAVAVLMMVRVQPVSGVARTWDHPPELSASQRGSAGVLVLALTALASWMMASSSLDSGLSGFSDLTTLALSACPLAVDHCPASTGMPSPGVLSTCSCCTSGCPS